jgi:hypothetical protein
MIGFCESGASLHEFLTRIPKETRYIHQDLEQMASHRGKKVMLILGNCPQYASPRLRKYSAVSPREHKTFTELLVGTIERVVGSALFLNVRAVCRKAEPGPKYSHCDCFSFEEQKRCTLTTMLEIEVARRYFGISFEALFTFSR